MQKQRSSEAGFSLVEAVIATGILSVGLLGGVAVLTTGMQRLSSSPNEVIAVQKAAETVESVFSARDAQNLTWSQIRNINGQSGSDGGVFIDGVRPLTIAGQDGVVNTVDDGAVEQMVMPGRTVTLNGFQREIKIRDVPNVPAGCGSGSAAPCALRTLEVTVTYLDGKATRTYTLTTFISSYS